MPQLLAKYCRHGSTDSFITNPRPRLSNLCQFCQKIAIGWRGWSTLVLRSLKSLIIDVPTSVWQLLQTEWEQIICNKRLGSSTSRIPFSLSKYLLSIENPDEFWLNCSINDAA